MLRSMSSAQFTEWRGFFLIRPFGEQMADIRHGIMTSSICNHLRCKGAPYKPQDFIPDFTEENKSTVSPEVFMEIFKTFT